MTLRALGRAIFFAEKGGSARFVPADADYEPDVCV